jgi:ankyrin repeat protein
MEHIGAINDLLCPPGGGSSSSRSADVHARTKQDGETPLFWAAQAGTFEPVKLLLAAGADPNAMRLSDAVRPLDLAVALYKPAVAVLLIEHGAEVCCRSKFLCFIMSACAPIPQLCIAEHHA